MDDERLCCPECDHCMESGEWDKIKDEDDNVTCPECEEEFTMDDLLSETEPDEEDDDRD